MAFKANYNQQRAERNRVKQAKKDAKQREKEAAREHQKLASGTSAAPSSKMAGDVPLSE